MECFKNRKATQIIEKELGHSISPLLVNASQEYLQRKKENKLGDELSGSMLCLGIDPKDQMFSMEEQFRNAQRRSSFDKLVPSTFSNRQTNYSKVEERRKESSLNDTPTLIPHSNKSQKRNMKKKIDFNEIEEFKYNPQAIIAPEPDYERKASKKSEFKAEEDQVQNNPINEIMASRIQNTMLMRQDNEELTPEEEEEEEEEEDIEYNPAEVHQSQHAESEYVSIDTQQKDDSSVKEETKEHKNPMYSNMEYYSDENLTPNKFRMISEMESELDHENIEYNISLLRQRGILIDKLPIRCGTFNREYMAIGTNSKCLKICNLGNIINKFDKRSEGEEKLSGNTNEVTNSEIEAIPIIFDQPNHHEGSIYCIDWTQCERLIASGSNDKRIKILICPALNDMDEGEESDNLLELTLCGHQAIVRTLCFHPKNELNLISGGEVDPYMKVWDTETGKNILNYEAHSKGVFSIKPSFDGSFFASVGKDANLKIWDLRSENCIVSLDCSEFGETTAVSLNCEAINSANKISAVSHISGIISLWDLNMRKCVNDIQAHEKEARSISFSNDGKYLASGGFDSLIKVMDLTSEFKVVQSLEHSNKVISVKWHSHYPLLLSTSADRSARIWIPA